MTRHFNVDLTVSAESDITKKQLQRGLQALMTDQIDEMNIEMISKISEVEQ